MFSAVKVNSNVLLLKAFIVIASVSFERNSFVLVIRLLNLKKVACHNLEIFPISLKY
jgi:hypothetical protein